MKRDIKKDSKRKGFFEGGAAVALAIAVTAFLCVFSAMIFISLKFEVDLPLVSLAYGENSIINRMYVREELTYDDCADNEILDESLEKSYKTNAMINVDNLGGADQTVETTEEESVEETETFTTDVADADDKSTSSEKTEDSSKSDNNTSATEEEEEELPYYIKINRQCNCITVYTKDDKGEYTVPYKAIICSTGLYNATPLGTFHLSTKYRWRELYGPCWGQYATRIHGGVLFHSVPYKHKSEDSLYTDKYNKLGQQASMGCVRLTVADAKWIAENCPEGTTVEIYDDADNPGPLGKPESITIDSDNPNKTWDPTDPCEDNPWNQVSEDN